MCQVGIVERMIHHNLVGAEARFEDRVMSHPGTNGYVSTWGAQLAGCQPTLPGA